MASKIFVMDMRDDGTCRLSLSFRGDRGTGISRLSCDLSRDDLLQLAVFAEACGLREALGESEPSELELEGLTVANDPKRAELTVVRQQGYSEQSAKVGRAVFQAEMAGVVEVCLTRAEESKHGETLRELLSEITPPEPLLAGLSPDVAEMTLYRLREIALMLLAARAAERGSSLGRLLRAKKSRERAVDEITAYLSALAGNLLPRQVRRAREARLGLRVIDNPGKMSERS
ncbi:hypothetical protein [Salipiger bermudensis]|uniref:hypothetical protein n=1 Tax=Salipiger bermudensis TaxID=344736 RepID=UPI001CD5447A|nr:hypothetical protein [Salipiger bermudensis]MCA0964010.1 hypothetical protein [Salipiger bermudensis]